jgi:hypothetical protein
MTETVLNTRSMLEPLLHLSNQPLRGIATDSALTVEKLYSMTHDSKEMFDIIEKLENIRFEWIR